MTEPDPAQVGERIEALLGELRVTAGGRAADVAEELVRLLVELYGTALGRIVGALDSLDPEVVRRLASDRLLASLFVLHDLHPDDTENRVLGALDRVRPYLGSHAGGVEYLGIDGEGVVHLRLQGSCDGCASSLVTVRLAIEAAIDEDAPDVAGVVVEGLTDSDVTALDTMSVGVEAPVAFLPSRSRTPSEPTPAPWVALSEAPPEAGLRPVELNGLEIVLVAVAGAVYAYRNRCPACGSAVDQGGLEGTVLVCPGCDERYDVRLAGRTATPAAPPLEPLPLIPEDGRWRVALPVVHS